MPAVTPGRAMTAVTGDLQLAYSHEYGEHIANWTIDQVFASQAWHCTGYNLPEASYDVMTPGEVRDWVVTRTISDYSPLYWYALVDADDNMRASRAHAAFYYKPNQLTSSYELQIRPNGLLQRLIAHTLPTLDYTDTIQPSTEGPTMINLNLKREDGKLVLYVNAKELHDDLDAIGVSFTGDRYNNQPAASHSIADARTMTLSSNVLLTRKYPHKVDLTGVFPNPPSYNNLKKLCESAHDQTRKILEHYQPIDISVEIHKKLVG